MLVCVSLTSCRNELYEWYFFLSTKSNITVEIPPSGLSILSDSPKASWDNYEWLYALGKLGNRVTRHTITWEHVTYPFDGYSNGCVTRLNGCVPIKGKFEDRSARFCTVRHTKFTALDVISVGYIKRIKDNLNYPYRVFF